MFKYEQVKDLNDLELEVYNYIMRHQEKVLEMKIRELAEGSHVSTTTVLRFCKKMGCNGYSEFKVKYKLNFGVYFTPAESLCHTALKRFRDKYGVIPNVSDKEYFTNSMHVPVWKQVTPFEKIDIESQLTGYSSGGWLYSLLKPC